MSNLQMHLKISKEQGAKYAIVPGSLSRVERIAAYLDNAEKLADHREFITYVGYLDGERVLVTSTGIGGPSTGIAVEELSRVGVDTFVRIGTCASLSERVNKGDVFIPTGVVRMEGTSTHYLPIEFPAVPTYELVKHLEQGAIDAGYAPKMGINITKDSFYTQTEPENMPVGPELVYKWNAYVKGGAETTAMEEAMLFIVGSALGARTASILASATSLAGSKETHSTSDDIEKVAIEAGIAGLRRIIKADREI